MAPAPSKVFISYSHDSPEHKDLVLALAQRLRKEGVDAQLDQYAGGRPPEGWPRWMLDKLEWAEFVVLICTETYYRRFRGHGKPGEGRGVDWEGQLITLEIYKAKSRTRTFVPVIFDPQNERFIPEPLSDHFYCLDSEDRYQDLYTFLTGQVGVLPLQLGSVKELPGRDVKPLTFELAPDLSPAQFGRHQTAISNLSSTITDRLLPYLVDRQEQNNLLREMIHSHRQQHRGNPLICFFHGSPEQCLPEYQQCLEEEHLAGLLGLSRGSVIHFKVVPWPASGYLGWGTTATRERSCEQFWDRLGRTIYDQIKISGERDETAGAPLSWADKISAEIKTYPEPLAIGFYLDATDFFIYPPGFLDWFVTFWETIPVNPYCTCLVFVFVTYRHESLKGLLRFLRRLVPDPCRKRMKNPSGYVGAARIIPELGCLSRRHVTEWVHTYRTRIEKHWRRPAFTLNSILQDHLDKNGDQLSMRGFAKVASDLLYTSENSASNEKAALHWRSSERGIDAVKASAIFA
jgi:hypothetical protein